MSYENDDQVRNGNVNEEAASNSTVRTRAPQAFKKGTKAEDWYIDLPHNLPDTLEGMIETLTEKTVYQLAYAQYIIGFQSAVRRMAEAGKEDEEIASTMSTWKPGDRLGLGGDPIQRTMANFGNLTPEQQAELMAKLSAMQKA